jgi:hypothetical protein
VDISRQRLPTRKLVRLGREQINMRSNQKRTELVLNFRLSNKHKTGLLRHTRGESNESGGLSKGQAYSILEVRQRTASDGNGRYFIPFRGCSSSNVSMGEGSTLRPKPRVLARSLESACIRQRGKKRTGREERKG